MCLAEKETNKENNMNQKKERKKKRHCRIRNDNKLNEISLTYITKYPLLKDEYRKWILQ